MTTEIRIIIEDGKPPVVDTFIDKRHVIHDDKSASIEQAIAVALNAAISKNKAQEPK